MKRVLFIAGNSGSGKSYITRKLIEDYDNSYYKLEQYTTRPKRSESENEYYYIDKNHYDIIKDRLMAVTIVNGNYYGTIPTLKEEGIAVVIVNALGLKNGIDYVKKHNDIEYRVLYLENDTPFELRPDARNTYQEAKDILCELDNLPSNSYKVLINNIEKPLSINEVHTEIEDLFKICKDCNHRDIVISCPWKTCIHNTGKSMICKSNTINLVQFDSTLTDLNGDNIDALECKSYKFDKDFTRKL